MAHYRGHVVSKGGGVTKVSTNQGSRANLAKAAMGYAAMITPIYGGAYIAKKVGDRLSKSSSNPGRAAGVALRGASAVMSPAPTAVAHAASFVSGRFGDVGGNMSTTSAPDTKAQSTVAYAPTNAENQSKLSYWMTKFKGRDNQIGAAYGMLKRNKASQRGQGFGMYTKREQ